MANRFGRDVNFLGGIAAIAAGASLPGKLMSAASHGSRDALYPPMDLSYFDSPIPPAPSEIHFGYASITWGGNDRQAIADALRRSDFRESRFGQMSWMNLRTRKNLSICWRRTS